VGQVTADELIAFEKRVADAFKERQVHGPIHLSGGNEKQLIEVFAGISREDYVFSTYRSHYHALLHGIDPEWLFAQILAGRSMNIVHPEHRFFTSAIVGGMLPIAVGVAAALNRQGSPRKVWCFVGDMAATTGTFHESVAFATGHDLPLGFVIEDNGLSCDSPTSDCWGGEYKGTHYTSALADTGKLRRYRYTRTYPHVGTGEFIQF
jgi:TPP-dependent pyruvate/acetoin dehydrogenase alpha subunit